MSTDERKRSSRCNVKMVLRRSRCHSFIFRISLQKRLPFRMCAQAKEERYKTLLIDERIRQLASDLEARLLQQDPANSKPTPLLNPKPEHSPPSIVDASCCTDACSTGDTDWHRFRAHFQKYVPHKDCGVADVLAFDRAGQNIQSLTGSPPQPILPAMPRLMTRHVLLHE